MHADHGHRPNQPFRQKDRCGPRTSRRYSRLSDGDHILDHTPLRDVNLPHAQVRPGVARTRKEKRQTVVGSGEGTLPEKGPGLRCATRRNISAKTLLVHSTVVLFDKKLPVLGKSQRGRRCFHSVSKTLAWETIEASKAYCVHQAERVGESKQIR